ncbi:MAG TPA: hypothetical protein VHM01_23960 [Alphaproteobacteria bacterium]|nr:hypothetical protein [Alphaproteobacteria bacterium]
MKFRGVARVGTALLLMAGPACADDTDAAPGVAHSTSFLALTPDTAVVVRPLDNSRANLALKQHFAAALKKRTVRVNETAAPYVLNFETEVDQAILRGRPGEAGDRGMLRYVLTATLDDERTGRRLWQGKASYAGAPADEATTMAAMAAILADQLGQTVRQKAFRIE